MRFGRSRSGLRRRWIPLGGVLLALVAPAGCRDQGGGDVPGASVAIGVALNPQRPGMHTVYRGAEMAVEQLNAERRGRGRPFVIKKGPPNVTSAVEIAALMRADPSVVAVVGHPESGTTLDAAGVYADLEHDGANALAAVSPTGTSPALSGRSPWIFRVCPSDVAASEAAARFVLDSLRARRAAIVYRNDPYGRDWTRAFTKVFTDAGGSVIQRAPYLAGVTEWDAYAAHLRRLAPDVLLFPGGAEDFEPFFASLRAHGVRLPVLGGDATAPLAQKPELYAGIMFTSFFVATRPVSEEGRRFVVEYRRKFGEPPDPRAALSYDAAMLIGRAVLAAGANRAKVRDWLEEVGGKQPAFRGATGAIAFNDRHDVVNKPVVIERIGAPGGGGAGGAGGSR